MDKTSLEFYHIVNENRRKKEIMWSDTEESNIMLVPIDKKPNRVLAVLKYFIQGIGAIITAVLGFSFMALMTLLM